MVQISINALMMAVQAMHHTIQDERGRGRPARP